MIKYFEGGKYWVRGKWRDPFDEDENRLPKPRACLMSAYREISLRDGIKGMETGRYIQKAIYEYLGRTTTIVEFNDSSMSFTRIENVLRRAKKLAEQDI